MEKNKGVLVVGGSKGLGKAIASNYVLLGYKVFSLSRTPPTDLSGVIHIADDFTKKGVAQKYLSEIQPAILIISAATGLYKPVIELNEDEIDAVIVGTLTGSVHWISEAISSMGSGAKIGWIASLTALLPNANWSVYAACKAGVIQFIDSVRADALQRGITITTCFPGCLNTNFHINSNTITPQSAVDPESITPDLLSSINRGDYIWAAPMDQKVVSEFSRVRLQLLTQFQGALK